MSCDAGWWRSKAARSSETRMQEGTMHRLWNRVDFAFSSAWQNFWRNAAVSIASVLIVWVVLLALGSLLLVLHSLDQIVALEKTKASAISVYLADTTPLSSAMDFKLHLESDPRVSSVEYVSKDQAMARFRQLPALDPSVIDTLGTNPLPASLDVTVRDIRDLAAIDQEVRTSPLVDKSPSTNYEPNVIDKIILLARVAGIAGLATAGEGRGSVCLLAGEPGIGKTRLATEAAALARQRGFLVLTGRCDETAAAPYQPFVEALRQYLDRASREQAEE